LDQLPQTTIIEKRDRALIAFTYLTGIRDGALASLRIGDVDLIRDVVVQDPRHVKTKNSKTIRTWFFPVGSGIRGIVEEWVTCLTVDMGRGPEDPLFPATRVTANSQTLEFEWVGLKKDGWASAEPIRYIFRRAFAYVGLPYFNPHSFRRTLALLGQRVCRTPEELKAWSQNLGHENMLTTFTSYGTVPLHRQEEILRTLFSSPGIECEPDREDLELIRQLKKQILAKHAVNTHPRPRVRRTSASKSSKDEK
jgi:integrase